MCVCLGERVFCLFTPFLVVLFEFYRKNLIILHLLSRFMTSSSEQFLKRKEIAESKFLILVNYSSNVIQITAVIK